MKYKYDMVWIDRVDEDRWLLSFVISVIFLLFVYSILSIIEIPVLPQKPKIIEDIEFVKEEVPKKEIQQQQQQPQEVKKEDFVEEETEIVIDVFKEFTQETNFPQDFAVSEKLQIVPEQDPNMMPTEAVTRISKGEFMQETEIDPMQTPQGFTDFDQNYNETVIVQSTTGDHKIESNKGLSTAPKAYNPDKPLSVNGFKGVIKWEDYLDPILKWVDENSVDIGKIVSFEMARDDKTVLTAKATVTVEGEKYLLYIASKQVKRQLTICLVNEVTDKYIMLIDQGLTKSSTYLKVGEVRRDSQNNIVRFSGADKSVDDPVAKKYMAVFWSWAETISK